MYTSHILKNGTRVLLIPQHDTQAVTVLTYVPVGSRHESLALSGASHFIEHLMFKGTERRPTTLHISRDLDRIGAEYNAFTGKEYTGYYIKANAGHLDLALDMLSDMLFHSTFKAEEFERERKVIYEEINRYDDNPEMHLDDVFEGLIFRGHQLGRLITGTKETMAGITRNALIEYRDDFYQPKNFVIAVAGNLRDNVLDRIDDTFGKITSEPLKARRPQRFSRPPVGPKVEVCYRDIGQTFLALGVPSFGIEDPRAYALTLLSNILGGTMSSRLFVAVRERRGLAYSVRTQLDTYHDTGAFSVFAGLDSGRLMQAIRVILVELRRIRDRGVTTEELLRAQDNIEGHIVLSLEESSAQADWHGKQALLRKEILTFEEKMAKLRAVDRSAVQAVARELIHTNRLHLALIGPFKDAAPFKKILSIL